MWQLLRDSSRALHQKLFFRSSQLLQISLVKQRVQSTKFNASASLPSWFCKKQSFLCKFRVSGRWVSKGVLSEDEGPRHGDRVRQRDLDGEREREREETPIALEHSSYTFEHHKRPKNHHKRSWRPFNGVREHFSQGRHDPSPNTNEILAGREKKVQQQRKEKNWLNHNWFWTRIHTTAASFSHSITTLDKQKTWTKSSATYWIVLWMKQFNESKIVRFTKVVRKVLKCQVVQKKCAYLDLLDRLGE